MADLGGGGQGPAVRRLAEVAGAAMEQGAESRAAGVVEGGAGRLGAVGLLAQAGGALGGEGSEDIADGLGGAAEPGADLRRLEPLGAGQEDLGPPEREGRG